MDDDRIPEERDERYTQLVALLRRGLREPEIPSAIEQSSIIARARERLMRAYTLASRAEEPTIRERPLQTGPRPVLRAPTQRERLARLARDLAAVLLVGMLLGATLLTLRATVHPSSEPPPTASTGPTSVSEVNGLRASIHVVTPGPYFLRELVSLDVSLTNQTDRPFALDGGSEPDFACNSSALSAQITAGGAPTYTLPQLPIGCTLPLFMTRVAPGQTLTLHEFLPVTRSGAVTITMGGMRGLPRAIPLDGHWPSVTLRVDPRVPSNRALSLRSQGAQIIVQAPLAARTHLLYLESITCDGYAGGGSRLDWSPLPTGILSQPACLTAHRHWEYIVGAPGYAIVAGFRDS